MQIVELRHLRPRDLDAVFLQEQRYWLEELHWDYRPSAELIRRFLDARTLLGAAVVEAGAASGYAFYVLEETKGLIGGMFTQANSEGNPCVETARHLLRHVAGSLQHMKHLRRVECQLIPFGLHLNPTLAELGFRVHPRLFMLLPLKDAGLRAAPVPAGLRLDGWDDAFFQPCATLIARAYQGHVDSRINDQYCSEPSAMRFLKNIVILPGCGQFQADASFVVRRAGVRGAEAEELVGAVLTSEVSRGVGHITQVCVLPEFRSLGIGLRLMEAAIRAIKSRRFHALSLTVTQSNANAVRLYERLGFQTVQVFAAGVWEAPE